MATKSITKPKSSIFNPRKRREVKKKDDTSFEALTAKIENIKENLRNVLKKCEFIGGGELSFNQGTTDRRLCTFERNVLASKYKFPLQFVQLYNFHDGCSEELFFASLKKIQEEYKNWRNLSNSGCFDDAEHERRDRRVNLSKWFHPGWIPIANDNGDHIIMDLAPTAQGKIGQIFVFSHEIGFVRYLADNIFDYLSQIKDLNYFNMEQ